MSEQTLAEKMEEIFSADENVKEWIILGKIPSDIAEIAAVAMQPPEGAKRPIAMPGQWPDEYNHIGWLIQKEFFPNAPPLERGGFMKALAGGPAPDWLVASQVTDQIVAEARNRGNDIQPAREE